MRSHMRHVSYARVFLGLILVAAGIVLLVYAQHDLHQEQPFFLKVRDWFVGVGDWFKGTAVSTPSRSTNEQVALWSGAALSAIGVLLLLFCKKKR
jgi:hypothetical protein